MNRKWDKISLLHGTSFLEDTGYFNDNSPASVRMFLANNNWELVRNEIDDKAIYE